MSTLFELSPYSIFLDEQNSLFWNCGRDNHERLLYLYILKNHFNDKLRAYGAVYLNDVYELLGIARKEEFRGIGWKIGIDGDNYIDFEINYISQPENRDFINGNVIILDFNVDGYIG